MSDAEIKGVQFGLAVRDAVAGGEARGVKAGLAVRDAVGGVGSFFGGLVAGIRGPEAVERKAKEKKEEEECDARVIAIIAARRRRVS